MKDRILEEKKIRQKRNLDIIKRMREGDTLRTHDAHSSWFPPRPVIEKDPKAVRKLYGDCPIPHDNSQEKHKESKIVSLTEK